MSEEQPPVVEQPVIPAGAEEERKLIVFAPRIPMTLRQQVEGLQGITGQNVNEVGVEALTDWVAKKLADEEVQEKAMAEIEAEERRLQAKRANLASILGTSTTAQATSAVPANTGRGRSTGKARKAGTI